jgi:hypothetical protein
LSAKSALIANPSEFGIALNFIVDFAIVTSDAFETEIAAVPLF